MESLRKKEDKEFQLHREECFNCPNCKFIGKINNGMLLSCPKHTKEFETLCDKWETKKKER